MKELKKKDLRDAETGLTKIVVEKRLIFCNQLLEEKTKNCQLPENYFLEERVNF